MTILWRLASTFGWLSLLSIGGANATVPEIHRQVVDRLHWMDDRTFANLIAIGQTAPGPNVLVISIIGWHVGGLGGLLAATAAFIVPSALLALAASRLLTRFSASRSSALLKQAFAPIAVGFMLASGIVMTRAAFAGPLTLVIVVGVAALVFGTKMSPYWGIVAGCALGTAAHLIA